ncbi:HNH endonuclease [Candidatus Thorarchaeota archaeon]|nr:MAG: HNH endonuclease [Candidatus Thorarchaeota archaeon]
MTCPICRRPLGIERLEEHHLVPKTFGGRETVTVHKMCHQKIHATFSERELQHHYHTSKRILEHSEIQKFVKWISKKPLDYYDKNDDTKSRKRRR